MATSKYVIAESSGSEDEGHSSGKDNSAPYSRNHFNSPSVIPASDEELTASLSDLNIQNSSQPRTKKLSKDQFSRSQSQIWGTPLQSTPANNDNGKISGILQRSDPSNSSSRIGASKAAVSVCEESIHEFDNVTSTPMLSNIRKLKPLDDLDMTAITEDGDEMEDPDRPNRFRRTSPNQARNRRRISSSSSNESEAETINDSQHDSVIGLDGSDSVESQLLDISGRVDKLNLGGSAGSKPTQIKKKFNFKEKQGTTVTIDSDSENSGEFLDTIHGPGVSSSSGESSAIRLSSTDESPEVVQIQRPYRVDPPIPKYKGLPVIEPKIQFIDLPVAPVPVARSVGTNPGYQVGVKAAISKLAETIQSIPKENELSPNPDGLKADLYDHQRYGLEWLSWREQHFPGGGILADEMGLGKTIMIIALVLKGKMGGDTRKNDKENSWISADTRKLVPSRTTLVVVPPSVLGQWEQEIKNKAKGMRVYAYHGPKRTTSAAVLVQNDFVLTTYQTLGSEVPKMANEKFTQSNSPLLRIQWERVVLDEGHVIRNQTTVGAHAVCRLNAYHRWIVTGTPVHNRPSDLHSLVKFLRLDPFDDAKVWDFWIGLKNVSAANMERLNVIGKALILRRTKEEVQLGGGNVRSIPPKTVVDVKVELTPEERQIYDHLHNFAQSQVKMFLKNQQSAQNELQRAANNYVAGKMPKPQSGGQDINFTHIFTLLLRLRQASVLPFLITTMLEDEDEDLSNSFDPLNEGDLYSRKNPVFSEEFQSAKLRQLYQDLEELREKCRSENRPMEKVVVVSQWTTLLDIVRSHLMAKGFTLTTISGQVKLSDRMDIMAQFNNNPKRPQIMLLSLAAGGVGLNLIGANNLFFLDIHWNPQLELQAQDRVHRFGQTKDVTIKRYISGNTMEERVLALQELKLNLANGLLSNSKNKVGSGVSMQDMRMLFEI